ncbi:hypothetical protein SAMN04487997_1220 [Frateuria terrea]|uniref:Uncharacterized protein n=1 Tax=Frateuria terrea TaxID=529704 RepID=A0A1H6SF39_9GAMM|nr:hypothetical protein SAMN04487997_1220 [Frateuria terrea]SFP23197.1 hypothetical protein SAMN02927913_1135 [Frateuria terrea]
MPCPGPDIAMAVASPACAPAAHGSVAAYKKTRPKPGFQSGDEIYFRLGMYRSVMVPS